MLPKIFYLIAHNFRDLRIHSMIGSPDKKVPKMKRLYLWICRRINSILDANVAESDYKTEIAITVNKEVELEDDIQLEKSQLGNSSPE
jgi:hypothetical protein